MKKLFYTLACTMLACMAISAHAVTLPHNFTDDNGANFSPKNAYSVEKVPGAVNVVASNGLTYTYADSSGALYTKLLNYMSTTGSYYQLPGTLLHFNVTEAAYITCNGGGASYFFFPNNYVKWYYDSCAAKAAVVARSN